MATPCNDGTDWMSTNVPPPEAFASHENVSENQTLPSVDADKAMDSSENLTDETGSRREVSGSNDETNVAADPATNVNQQDACKSDANGGDQMDLGQEESSPAKVEIIGHTTSESENIDENTIQSFSPSNKKSLRRSSKKRAKLQQSKGVETLAHSEEKIRSGEKMKVDITDRSSLDVDDMSDPEEVDYVSDDAASSVSSFGDETIPALEDVTWPNEIMSRLSEPDFDVWRLGRDSMVDHLEYMYHDFGVTRAWRIPRTTLRMFLLGVRERYQDNPYHNFKHCFSVTQMTYSMVCKLKLRHLLSVDDLGMMLTAAICHDVDHPGLNNGYHAHAHSPLAILYNYKSILEQHHFAVACRILTNKERNIFQNVPNRDDILKGTRELILATDLALHKDIMEEYRRCIKDFDFKNRTHVLSLLKIIIKCADVSNEVRPESVATPWVELLFSEYYEQSAREKRERLPVTPYMDPDKVDVTDSQEGFIKGMMLPMYNDLASLIVDARIYYVNPLKQALQRYEIQKRQGM